jgi:hypothetical protein
VTARTFVRDWPSFSRPVEVTCDDGTHWVVKGLRHDQPLMSKAVTTERAAGLLGQALGAPVPRVGLVDVGPLAQVEPRMAHLIPGLAHASARVPNCSDRQGVTAPVTERNRRGYAALAVLYGWFQANDHQVVSTLDAAADVYSVDHGHFLPGGPDWSAASLQSAGAPQPDQQFAAHVLPADVDEVLRRLQQISDEAIARAVAQPEEWAMPMGDRVVLGMYLAKRRDMLTESLGR